MRVVPLLVNHYKQNSSSPELFSLGFAAYLLFTKPVKQEGTKMYGALNDKEYIINDDMAASFIERWNNFTLPQLVKAVLSDVSLWGGDLSLLPGFYESVLEKLNLILDNGAHQALEIVQSKKEIV